MLIVVVSHVTPSKHRTMTSYLSVCFVVTCVKYANELTFMLFQGTENVESRYPNISKPYEETSTCHNRKSKPHRRKKPGQTESEGEADETSERDEDNYVDEEHGDKTKVYSSISLQESSRLNTSTRSRSTFELQLSVVVYYIVLAFRT